MIKHSHSVTILCAEDDMDDRLLLQDALAASDSGIKIRFVDDGLELLDYLRRRGDWIDPTDSPTPSLVLLDLNMPRMDGRQALVALKADPILRRIPVVVLTTSGADSDVARSYDDGANSYLVKPVTFRSLVEVMRELSRYWFEVATLPASAPPIGYSPSRE